MERDGAHEIKFCELQKTLQPHAAGFLQRAWIRARLAESGRVPDFYVMKARRKEKRGRGISREPDADSVLDRYENVILYTGYPIVVYRSIYRLRVIITLSNFSERWISSRQSGNNRK